MGEPVSDTLTEEEREGLCEGVTEIEYVTDTLIDPVLEEELLWLGEPVLDAVLHVVGDCESESVGDCE